VGREGVKSPVETRGEVDQGCLGRRVVPVPGEHLPHVCLPAARSQTAFGARQAERFASAIST
jgi:hypothetical protein